MIMKKTLLAVILIGLVYAAGGCGITGGGSSTFDVCSAVSVVAMQQHAIVGAAKLVKQYPMTAAQKAKVEQAYNTWADAQALATTALVAVNDSGGNPTTISLQTYTQALMQIGVLAADFIAIYESINSSPAPMMKGQSMKASAEAAAPCVIADADITAQLAVPAWSAL